MFALAEKVKGRHFSAVTYGRASFVGLALVLLVFVIALQNDIGMIRGEGFQVDRWLGAVSALADDAPATRAASATSRWAATRRWSSSR